LSNRVGVGQVAAKGLWSHLVGTSAALSIRLLVCCYLYRASGPSSEQSHQQDQVCLQA